MAPLRYLHHIPHLQSFPLLPFTQALIFDFNLLLIVNATIRDTAWLSSLALARAPIYQKTILTSNRKIICHHFPKLHSRHSHTCIGSKSGIDSPVSPALSSPFSSCFYTVRVCISSPRGICARKTPRKPGT